VTLAALEYIEYTPTAPSLAGVGIVSGYHKARKGLDRDPNAGHNVTEYLIARAMQNEKVNEGILKLGTEMDIKNLLI
jgi:hypothetical protein